MGNVEVGRTRDLFQVRSDTLCCSKQNCTVFSKADAGFDELAEFVDICSAGCNGFVAFVSNEALGIGEGGASSGREEMR